MKEQETRTAFNAFIVPWWLSALAVMECKARNQPPTVAAVDEVLKKSLECAIRCASSEDSGNDHS